MVSFGVLDRFKPKKETFDPVTTGYTQALMNSLNPMPANEEAAMRELEINIHTIRDEGITRRLDNLSVTPEYTVNLPIMDDSGNVETKEITIPPQPVGWALACRIATSEMSATRFLTKKEAMRKENWQHAEFLKIKRDMRRSDRDIFGHAINQLEGIAVDHIHDSVGGQKMLSLKTSGKNVRVGVENKIGEK